MIGDASIMGFILLCGKELGQRSIPPLEIVFLVNALAAALNVAVRYRGTWEHIRPTKPLLHLYRAFFGVASTGCLLGALHDLSLFEMSALSLLIPAITCVLSLQAFNEKLSSALLVAMACSITGVSVLLLTQHSQQEYSLPSMSGIALGGASVALSVLNSLNQKRIGVGETVAASMIFGPLWSALLALPFALYTWVPIGTDGTVLIGVYGILLASRMATRYLAFRHADVSVLMPFEYTQLLFSAVLSSYFFGQAITAMDVAGMVLVVAGGLLVVKSQFHLARGGNKV